MMLATPMSTWRPHTRALTSSKSHTLVGHDRARPLQLAQPGQAPTSSATRPQCRRRVQQRVLAEQAGWQAMHGSVVAKRRMRFGVVVGRFNDLVTKLLVAGTMDAFKSHGVALEDVTVCWVPGSFELPVVAKSMAKSGSFDAVVCIGVVVRGATTHYDAVVSAATSGVLNASLDTGVPTVFGVLTCDTMEQALDRAGGKVGNKGAEAAITAIEMANLLTDLREAGLAVPAWGAPAAVQA